MTWVCPVKRGSPGTGIGFGIGIAIGIDHKVENIFPKHICRSPTPTANPIPIPKGFRHQRLARTSEPPRITRSQAMDLCGTNFRMRYVASAHLSNSGRWWNYAASSRTGARRSAGLAPPDPVSGTSRHTRRNVSANAIICAPKKG